MPGDHIGWPTTLFSPYDQYTNDAWQSPVTEINVSFQGVTEVDSAGGHLNDQHVHLIVKYVPDTTVRRRPVDLLGEAMVPGRSREGALRSASGGEPAGR